MNLLKSNEIKNCCFNYFVKENSHSMLLRYLYTMLILCLAVFTVVFFYCTVPVKASETSIIADKVIVIKSKRLLVLMREGEILKAYRVALGKKPVGRKTNAGDKKTPEGVYFIDYRNPESRFHKSLRISYPNESDILNAEKSERTPGGDIMIHGLPDNLKELDTLHRFSDWTDGCIAVTNSEIEEIWTLVPDGTTVEIKP